MNRLMVGLRGAHRVCFPRAPETFETLLHVDKHIKFTQKRLQVAFTFLAELSVAHRGAPHLIVLPSGPWTHGKLLSNNIIREHLHARSFSLPRKQIKSNFIVACILKLAGISGPWAFVLFQIKQSSRCVSVLLCYAWISPQRFCVYGGGMDSFTPRKNDGSLWNRHPGKLVEDRSLMGTSLNWPDLLMLLSLWGVEWWRRTWCVWQRSLISTPRSGSRSTSNLFLAWIKVRQRSTFAQTGMEKKRNL